MAKSKKHKNVLKNVLVVVLALIISLAVLEVGFRLFKPQPLWDECHRNHPDYGLPMFDSHSLLGWDLKTNSTWCVYQPDTAQKIILETNSLGLRGTQEYSKEKADDTFRVLLFGDSFVWGEELHYKQTFGEQLRKQLEKKLGVTVEVIPFGVSAYGTTQSFLTYMNKGREFEADLVMYLFYQNDLTDSFKEDPDLYPTPLIIFEPGKVNIVPADVVAKDRRNVTGNASYFARYNYDIANVNVPSPVKQVLLSNSHFFTFADTAFSKSRRAQKQKDSDTVRLIKKTWTTNLELFKWVQSTDPDLFRYGKNLVQLIDMFSVEVRNDGKQFVLVNIPSEYQVRDKFLDKVAKDSSWDNDVDEDSKNYVLNTLAKMKNIPYIDLTGVAYKEPRFYFKTDQHWSPVGARLSAKYVAAHVGTKK